MSRRRTVEEGTTTSHRMIGNYANLTLELSDYFLGNFRWECKRGMQAHNGKWLQGSDLRAE